ncbi:hypothetical protein SH668x_003419 [Planctomicrobium sp. SH668]|uniref:hypothetical protein n=1 Tax=Planctomicrobium sp. SH668 TaxID=3448126 RepID=UPI003F5BA807
MRLSLCTLILIACCNSGCHLFDWAAPHNLWKLNRQPAMGGEDGYFSVPAQVTPLSESEAPQK